MAKNKSDELTPMMRQYTEIKKEHQDKVLFFRLGDFYEMFDDDAIEVSRLLNLTLTHRGRCPMCGIPFHAAKNYIKRLLEEGKKIAICEQLSLPENPRQLAERKVIQIYTPATVVEDEYLDSQESSWILSIVSDKKGTHLAYTDISTGEFFLRNLPLERSYTLLEDALTTVQPKEIIISDDTYFTDKALRGIVDRMCPIVTKLPSWYFTLKEGRKETQKQFGPNALEQFEINEKDPILSAISALLKYILDMNMSELPQLRGMEWVSDEKFLFLSGAAVRSLELVENMSERRKDNTLFSAMNRTVTSSGARMLREEILKPLSDIELINERLSWTERFYENDIEMEEVRSALRASGDLERLSSRMSMRKTLPKDLISAGDTIRSLFDLLVSHPDYVSLVDQDTDIDLDALLEFSSEIESGINRECTNINNEGTIILPGYDEELDRYYKYVNDSAAVLSDYIEKLREETGITIMKVGENRIIGHYIEVSKGQLDKVPEYFIRRQTLVSGERFSTPELGKIEEEIFGAKEKSALREKAIFKSFVDRAEELNVQILKLGILINRLDFHSSLAYLAHEMGYVKPVILPEGELDIVNGRHPVVEQNIDRNTFQMNGFSTKEGRFALITGPNMAGKSTYLRQTALICLMAHMGAYVPAEKAEIPLMDKIFCRVGASDNLAKGESTFLVEMSESAQILRMATRKSLVIMDEIGRGTSTEDGMSIAYSIMQYLKDLGSITMFATHYHELTRFDTYGMQLITLEVMEEKTGITFLRKAVPGIATSSYGIHVARIAGLPREVIKEATAFQKKHFADYEAFTSDQGDLFIDGPGEEEGESAADEAAEAIRDFDLENSSPMEAFMLINELKKRL